MKFPFYIALRYLFAKKSHNIINVISGISVVSITVGTMALIIVLSVFNGFENLVTSLLNSFNPDLVISASKGKTFSMDAFPLDKIMAVEGVANYAEVLEETALVTYRDRQHIVKMKGVGEGFEKINQIDSMMLDGRYLLLDGSAERVVIGHGVESILGVNREDYTNPLVFYVPKRGKAVSINPAQAFRSGSLYASGSFTIHADVDVNYTLVPINFARRLLDYSNEVTAVELSLKHKTNNKKVQREIEKILGEQFEVKNRFQQQELLYSITRSEKWAIFLILCFIMLLAAFNIVGSLSMLIIEKRKDIGVLRSLGANLPVVRKIFLLEGAMITFGGSLIGVILGSLVCLLQQHFGIIGIQAEGSFIIEAYPVKMLFSDVILVFITVSALGFLAALIPVQRIKDFNFIVRD